MKAADIQFLIGGTASTVRPSFIAVQNATQSIANNTNVTVLFQSTTRDTDSAYVAGTGLYTVATAGLWQFTAAISFASNATGLRANTLVLGGVSYVQESTATVDSQGRLTVSVTALLTAGQTAQVQAFQTNSAPGGALNTAGNATCVFSGVWLGS